MFPSLTDVLELSEVPCKGVLTVVLDGWDDAAGQHTTGESVTTGAEPQN